MWGITYYQDGVPASTPPQNQEGKKKQKQGGILPTAASEQLAVPMAWGYLAPPVVGLFN
jgi:hypothetical protein